MNTVTTKKHTPKPFRLEVQACLTVADLLEDPRRWSQYNFGMTEQGPAHMGAGPDKIAWSIEAAIEEIYGFGDLAREQAAKVKALIDNENLRVWQRKHSHAEMLDLVKRAGI